MTRSRGRTGRRWRRARATCLAASDVCWLCGHEAADQADHHPPLGVLEQLGLDPCDLRYLRPAHGTRPCPTCGIRCNQAKGSRPTPPRPVAPRHHSRAW